MDIEEQGIIWGTVEAQPENHWVTLEAVAQPAPWIDPSHRIAALHLVHKMMTHYDFLGDIELSMHQSENVELTRKEILNAMFEKADYFVNYIANGEKIPLVGTIET